MTRYRVVDVDNFDGEGPSSTERFITEPIDERMANFIAEALNEEFCVGGNAPRYYLVVDENYKLFIFEP